MAQHTEFPTPSPNRFDMVGFGPSAISFSSNDAFTEGTKTTNVESAPAYISRIRSGQPTLERFYAYNSYDLRVFYLTRRLAALAIEEHDYSRQFSTPHIDDFSEQLAVLSRAGLLENRRGMYVPTPRGMFFSDAIASLLTEKCKAEFPRRTTSYRSTPRESVEQATNMEGYM